MKNTKFLSLLLALMTLTACGGKGSSVSESIPGPFPSTSEEPSVEPSEEPSEEPSVLPSTSEEPSFDPTPYMTVIEEARDNAKAQLEEYLTNLEPYSDNGKAKIAEIIAEGKSQIDGCNKANEIIDILYLYEGKLDKVPNAKQEKAYEFISLMSGEQTSSGYNSIELVSADKDGKVIFNSLTAWGQIKFGSTDGNPYKVFETDLIIDYETVTWGSADLYINRRDNNNSYICAFTNAETKFLRKVSSSSTELAKNDPVQDMKKINLKVITAGTRKLVLFDDLLMFDINESTYNEGQLSFSLWQTELIFDNFKYIEYPSFEELEKEYGEDLEKSIYDGKIGKAQAFLDFNKFGDINLVVNDKGEIVQTNTGWSRNRFGLQTGNDFETFECDITPTYNNDKGYFTIDLRVLDDNNKFSIVFTNGTVYMKKTIWDTTAGGGVPEVIVEEINSGEIASGTTFHFKMLVSGWVKTIAINGKLFAYVSDKSFCRGLFGFDSNNATYKLENPVFERFSSQSELSSKNPDLWSSYYKQKFGE